jgi:hypothetical protein
MMKKLTDVVVHAMILQDRILPPKFVKSADRSDRLKSQICCPKEEPSPLSSPICRGPPFPTSTPKLASIADASTSIADISDAVKGTWLLDIADDGLIAISDDTVPKAVPACATSGASFSIML